MPNINSLQQIDSKYIGTPAKWREFLCLWEQKRIDLGLTDSNSDQLVWEYEVNSHQVANKIIETESRLMLTLPKSYKDFISATDGNHIPEWLLKKVYSEAIFSVEKNIHGIFNHFILIKFFISHQDSLNYSGTIVPMVACIDILVLLC